MTKRKTECKSANGTEAGGKGTVLKGCFRLQAEPSSCQGRPACRSAADPRRFLFAKRGPWQGTPQRKVLYLTSKEDRTTAPNLHHIPPFSPLRFIRDMRSPLRFSAVTGHFTQLIWADTFLVGCGITEYKEYLNGRRWNTRLYVCNYGPSGNIINGWMYRPGDACNECGENSNCYYGLCV